MIIFHMPKLYFIRINYTSDKVFKSVTRIKSMDKIHSSDIVNCYCMIFLFKIVYLHINLIFATSKNNMK